MRRGKETEEKCNYRRQFFVVSVTHLLERDLCLVYLLNMSLPPPDNNNNNLTNIGKGSINCNNNCSNDNRIHYVSGSSGSSSVDHVTRVGRILRQRTRNHRNLRLVMDHLNHRNLDAQEILSGIGFQAEMAETRIPERFLHSSQLKGIPFDYNLVRGGYFTRTFHHSLSFFILSLSLSPFTDQIERQRPSEVEMIKSCDRISGKFFYCREPSD